MADALHLLDNISSLKEAWLNHAGINAVKNVPQDLNMREHNCKRNDENFGNLENENNIFGTEASIRNELSSSQFEFCDLTNSMVTSGSFIIETHKEEDNCNYMNIESCDDQISGNSMIRIEVTPDFPCNIETESELRSNVSDFVLERRKKNDVEEGEIDLDKLYRCNHCEKEYRSKRSIVRHFELNNCIGESKLDEESENVIEAKKRGPKIVRLADNRYQCRHCDKTYTQKNNLFRHMREDHVKLAKPTSCNVCGKEFYNYRKLHQHLRCHSEKPFECSICGKRFSQVAHVQSHMFTHTGEKPHQCHICDKRFSKSFNLKIHIVRHNGEKQFKCRICQTEFFTHGELEKHVRIHTAERPYSCITCGKRFKQNGHLKKHLLSHTGQKPYKCTMCKKDYVNSSHLKRHILTHTGEKLPEHLCPICGNNFSQPSTVKRHIEKVHRKFSHV